jgi:glutathione S-transferase
MYQLYGIPTQNTLKTLYVLAEVGVPYQYNHVDLMKGEQKTPEFKKLTPVGKVPVLQHGEKTLFESSTICRYVAANSELYPKDDWQRAQVDQWLDFFSNHLGRQLSTVFFQRVIKPMGNWGETDEKACQEAEAFARDQFAVVESVLEKSKYLSGDAISIADICAYAYVEQAKPLKFSLADYPKTNAWMEAIGARDAIKKVQQEVPRMGA